MFTAVILAAGSSVRFGKDKLLEKVGDDILICKTVRFFASSDFVSNIVIVCNGDNLSQIKDAVQNNVPTERRIVFEIGEQTRAESSHIGLKSSMQFDDESVLITDADRCFVSDELLDRLVNSFDDNAIPVIRHPETLRIIRDGRVVSQVKDDNLYEIQTPQLYRKNELLEAYQNCFSPEATDESAVYFGFFKDKKMNMVPGDVKNIKVTFPSDL